jgi:hypothetical protein
MNGTSAATASYLEILKIPALEGYDFITIIGVEVVNFMDVGKHIAN